MNAPLEAAIKSHLAARAPDAVVALGGILRQRFGSHAQAVLFYGSCRRSNDDTGGIVDLYVLVDEYRAAHGSFASALANRLLAPNVYYLEATIAGRTARAKYAVVSLDQFERGMHWFHSYLWGRFAQPCGLLYAADETIRRRVVQALAAAACTFASRTLPRLPAEFDAEALWTRGLLLTYAAELRSERPDKIRALYADMATELDALTDALARKQGWNRATAGRFRNPSTRSDRWSSALRLGSAPGTGQGAQHSPPAESLVHLRRRLALRGLENRATLRREDRDHALHAPIPAPGVHRRALANVAPWRIPVAVAADVRALRRIRRWRRLSRTIRRPPASLDRVPVAPFTHPPQCMPSTANSCLTVVWNWRLEDRHECSNPLRQ